MNNTNKIKIFFYYIVSFLLIYRPYHIFHINSYLFLAIITFLFVIIDLFSRGKYVFNHLKNNVILFFIIGIFLSMFYCLIRVLLNYELIDNLVNLRIPQHLLILVYLYLSIFIVNRLVALGYSKDKLIEFLLKIATFQGFICLLMVLFPSFRTYAVNSFANLSKFNVGDYIFSTRIYGLSDSYTYGLPIINGLLSGVCFYYCSTRNKKYLFALPFILLVSLLNGRTGVLIALMSIIIVVIFINSKNKLKTILNCLCILLFLVVFSFIIKQMNSNMYAFISRIFYAFALNDSNIDYLTDRALFFPSGWNFVFGYGFRVYGGLDYNFIGKTSDIGYVNYMFLGGIIYTFLFVGSFIRYFLKSIKSYNHQNVLKIMIVLSSLIACWKGEIFNNINYVFTTLLLCNAFLFTDRIYNLEENKND